jgi:hypothetical protein
MPIAYLRIGCPFSFKLLLFLSEADLLNRFDVVKCDPHSDEFERVKAKLAQATGKQASFPTVEIEPGVYKSDSDALVQLYAMKNGIDTKTLPAYSFYIDSIFPQLEKAHE